MKKLRILFVLILTSFGRLTLAQELPTDVLTALKTDDAATLSTYVTKGNLENCYGNYSLLAHSVRYNAKKCFDVLIAKGANVNHICGNYKSPLFFSAEYGRVDMAKILINKGADTKFKYHDATLLSVAQEYKRD